MTGQSQLDFVPESISQLKKAAADANVALVGPKKAFLIQGDDRSRRSASWSRSEERKLSRNPTLHYKRAIQDECLNRLIFFGERSLKSATIRESTTD